MTDLKDRERAFEEKFAFDQEMRFKLEARRNRLLGIWAAEALGLEGDVATAYAAEIVATSLSHNGEDEIFHKITQDIAKAGFAIPEGEIRARMSEFMEQVHLESQLPD